MPRRRRKGHRHSARERHVFKVLKRSVKKKHPSWPDSRIWAMTMGMSPKTLHKKKFKTSTRTYSITHKRAAAARRLKRGRRRR